jgi:hypothetical protein
MGLARLLRTVREIPFLLVVSVFVLPAHAQYSGGSGTADDPYQIATAADLIALGETPDDYDYDKHFILTADIDLVDCIFEKAVIAWDTNNVGSDFQGTSFHGVFDGNGHVIKNLSIDSVSTHKDYLGLFGYVSYVGNIKDLGLENASITGGD